MTDGHVTLSPECFELALSRPVRVKRPTKYPRSFLVLYEAGTERAACFLVARRPHACTPVLVPVGEAFKLCSYAVLVHPPLAIHTPTPRRKKKGAIAS